MVEAVAPIDATNCQTCLTESLDNLEKGSSIQIRFTTLTYICNFIFFYFSNVDALIQEHGGLIGDDNVEDEKEKEVEDGGKIENKENEGEDTTKKEVEEEEEEVMEELNEFEENIRLSIIEDEPLLQETLDEIVPMWWTQEPFK